MMGGSTPKMPDQVKIAAPRLDQLRVIRRRKMQEEFGKREGRASTQLSGDSSARPTYSRTTLG